MTYEVGTFGWLSSTLNFSSKDLYLEEYFGLEDETCLKCVLLKHPNPNSNISRIGFGVSRGIRSNFVEIGWVL
jgi:hypothetical protein